MQKMQNVEIHADNSNAFRYATRIFYRLIISININFIYFC